MVDLKEIAKAHGLPVEGVIERSDLFAPSTVFMSQAEREAIEAAQLEEEEFQATQMLLRQVLGVTK